MCVGGGGGGRGGRAVGSTGVKIYRHMIPYVSNSSQSFITIFRTVHMSFPWSMNLQVILTNMQLTFATFLWILSCFGLYSNKVIDLTLSVSVVLNLCAWFGYNPPITF